MRLVQFSTKMNNDCLLNCVIYYKKNVTIKCLLICKQSNNLNTEYFWLLRNKIEFYDNKQINNNYYYNYKLYCQLNKLKIKLLLKLSLYELHVKNKLNLYNDQLQLLPTEIGHPVRDEP